MRIICDAPGQLAIGLCALCGTMHSREEKMVILYLDKNIVDFPNLLHCHSFCFSVITDYLHFQKGNSIPDW